MRVVVIGGGAVGSAVALFLRRLGGRAVEVHLVEPDPGLAQASSALSAGSIRQQFSNAINVRMSQFGFEVIGHADEWLGVDDAAVDLGFVPGAYLFLAGAAGVPVLRANHTVQRGCDAAVALLSPAEAQQRFGWLRVDDLGLTSLGLAGEGWFDGYAFARALAGKAAALGAQRLRARVTALERRGNRLVAARLGDGGRLEADVFVNAAGPWAGAVARLAGVALPVAARRRTVFVMSCPTALPPTPLVIDPSGVWFRSEGTEDPAPLAPAAPSPRGGANRLRTAGRRFIGGWSPGPGDADLDDLPLDQPDLAQFDDRVWPALAHRVPAFEALRVTSAWAGYYEVCTLDHNAIVGPHTELTNLVFANGFSGHGLQHAPAAGRGVAEWILLGRYDSLDLSPLRYARIAEGRPFVERSVI